MKKVFLFAAIAALSACNSGTETKDDSMGSMSSDSTKKDDIAYAYPVRYTNIEMGDSKHGQTVLNIWKKWDSGDLSGINEFFADSVELDFWDGNFIEGSRDSVLSTVQVARNNFSSVNSSITAVMSIKTLNKNTKQNENWVLLWGKEITTTKKGKTDSIWLHEGWRINEDGKIDVVNQYAELMPKTTASKSK